MIVALQIILRLLTDLIALTAFAFRRRRATAAEILVLRRQIALYKERGIKPRRFDPVTRISLALLSRFFNWRDALVVVRPETMIRWHQTVATGSSGVATTQSITEAPASRSNDLQTCTKIRRPQWMMSFFEVDHPYDRWLASFCASRVKSPGRRGWQRSLQRIAMAASPAGLLSGAHAH